MKNWIIYLLLAVSFARIFPQTREESQFSLAKNRFLEADYDVALHEFLRFLRLNPESVREGEAHYFIGQSRFFLEAYKDALDSFRIVRYRFPGSRYSRLIPFWEGVTLVALEQPVEGLERLTAYLASTEKIYVREALYYASLAAGSVDKYDIAWEYAEKMIAEEGIPEARELTAYMRAGVASGRVDETVAGLVRLNNDYPDNDAVMFMLAEMYYYAGKYDESRSLYASISSDDNVILGYRTVRNLFFEKDSMSEQQFQTAVINAEKMLDNDRKLLGELWEMALFYHHSRGKNDLGLNVFNKIRMTETEMRYAVLARAVDMYRNTGDSETAVELLEWFRSGVAEYGEDWYKASYGLAVIHAGRGQWDKAISILNRDPESVHLQEGWTYLKAQARYFTGDYDGCIQSAGILLGSFPGTEYYNETVLLIARSRRESGDFESALEHYAKIIELPGYRFAAMEYASILFHLGRYRSVINMRYKVEEKDVPNFTYYLGLSHVLLEEYDKGIPLLERLNSGVVEDSLRPYVLFYLGWAKFRKGAFSDALKNYKVLFDSWPMSETVTSARYTAGMCAFSIGDYATAASYFTDYSLRTGLMSEKNRGLFMAARSLRGKGDMNKSVLILEEVISSDAGGFWKDAYFELGSIYSEIGSFDKSIDAYSGIFRRDRSDPDGFRGMLEAGKTAYSAKQYDRAVAIFRELRDSGIAHPLMDVVLYYWGKTYQDSGKPYSAILIWDRLVERHPDSIHVFEVSVQSAENYQSMGELKKAADIYARLITRFPEDSSNIQIDVELDKISYMIKGQGDREAALSAIIGREKGAASKTGRNAIIELSQLYIMAGTRQSQLSFVLDLLKQVIDKGNNDPDTTSRALFLYGEYLVREAKYKEAVDNLLEAALVSPGPEDFIARALYRAAEVAITGNQGRDAREIISTLKTRFPESIWAEEADRLQGGRR